MTLTRILLFYALAFPVMASFCAEPFSGVYIHPSEFSSPDLSPEAREAMMDKALDGIQACGFTTVIPYANTTSGAVYWPETEAPRAGAWDWDTLGIFTGKARARGLKVMPALCVLAAGHDEPTGILNVHPDWALRDAVNKPLGWISPANEAARVWLTALVISLVKHVTPDGLMLDYMRFPSDSGTTLDPVSMAAFDGAALANETDADRKVRLQGAKEAALTQLMREIGGALRAHDPDLCIGLYTWGAHVASKYATAQCWPVWLQEGYLDLLNVSGYCYHDNYGDAYLEAFEKRLREAGELARQSRPAVELTFALGVKTSHGAVAKAADMKAYLDIARLLDYTGVAAFAWKSLEKFTDETAAAGYFRLSP